jgi:beta-phosphoglucomutase-like phosphatase (HAD superfamily)
MKILDKDLNQYQALLFDLDGTLIDSMPHHNQAWIDTMASYNVKIGQEFLMETAGMSSLRIVSIINERFNKSLDPKATSRKKRNQYLSNLDKIEIFEPIFSIVRNYNNKLPLGIITGGSHEVVDQLLPILKIDHYFDFIICADDTSLGKDSKEPYQLMGNKLKIDPTKCLFFDDGDVGLKGAKLTGMDVVHVDINHPDIFLS